MDKNIKDIFDNYLDSAGIPKECDIEQGILERFGPEGLARHRQRQDNQQNYINKIQLRLAEGPKGPSTVN